MGKNFEKLLALSEHQKHVRTAEGAKKYGVPIGSLITKDMIEAAKMAEKSVGISGDSNPKKKQFLEAVQELGAKPEAAQALWEKHSSGDVDSYLEEIHKQLEGKKQQDLLPNVSEGKKSAPEKKYSPEQLAEKSVGTSISVPSKGIKYEKTGEKKWDFYHKGKLDVEGESEASVSDNLMHYADTQILEHSGKLVHEDDKASEKPESGSAGGGDSNTNPPAPSTGDEESPKAKKIADVEITDDQINEAIAAIKKPGAHTKKALKDINSPLADLDVNGQGKIYEPGLPSKAGFLKLLQDTLDGNVHGPKQKKEYNTKAKKAAAEKPNIAEKLEDSGKKAQSAADSLKNLQTAIDKTAEKAKNNKPPTEKIYDEDPKPNLLLDKKVFQDAIKKPEGIKVGGISVTPEDIDGALNAIANAKKGQNTMAALKAANNPLGNLDSWTDVAKAAKPGYAPKPGFIKMLQDLQKQHGGIVKFKLQKGEFVVSKETVTDQLKDPAVSVKDQSGKYLPGKYKIMKSGQGWDVVIKDDGTSDVTPDGVNPNLASVKNFDAASTNHMMQFAEDVIKTPESGLTPGIYEAVSNVGSTNPYSVVVKPDGSSEWTAHTGGKYQYSALETKKLAKDYVINPKQLVESGGPVLDQGNIIPSKLKNLAEVASDLVTQANINTDVMKAPKGETVPLHPSKIISMVEDGSLSVDEAELALNKLAEDAKAALGDPNVEVHGHIFNLQNFKNMKFAVDNGGDIWGPDLWEEYEIEVPLEWLDDIWDPQTFYDELVEHLDKYQATQDIKVPKSNLPEPPNAIPDTIFLSTPEYLDYLSNADLVTIMKGLAENSGHGKVAGQHRQKMSKQQKAAWVRHWYAGEYDKAYQIEHAAALAAYKPDHTYAAKHPGNQPGFKKVDFAPAVAGEVAAGDTVAGDGIPSDAAALKNMTVFSYTKEFVHSYLTAAGMKNSTGLSWGEQRKWVQAHIKGDKFGTDWFSKRAEKNVLNGVQLSQPFVPPKPALPAGKMPSVAFAEFNPKLNYAVKLDATALNSYLQQVVDHGNYSVIAGQDEDTKKALVQLHYLTTVDGKDHYLSKADATDKWNSLMKNLTDQVTLNGASYHGQSWNLTLPNFGEPVKTFTKSKAQKKLDGFGEKFFVDDEKGEKFLFKVAKEEFRPYVEDAAHQAASLFGFTPAQSIVTKVDGQLGQIQSLIDHTKEIKGTAPQDLTDQQLQDVLREHVLDWAMDNDDAHDQNFLITPGGRVIGIDKGRAWVHFGKNQLNRHHLSSNAHLYYEDVYNAIASGNIDSERVQKAYKAVLKRAQMMSKVSDDEYRKILEYAFAKRPGYGTTSASSKDELIEHVLARKNNLVTDFEKFWTDLLSDAGVSKPAPSSKVEDQFHTGFSAELLDDVATAGSHGHATFFGGKELEDSHIMLQETHGKSGTFLQGQGQLRSDADSKLTQWLKQHSKTKVGANGNTPDETLDPKSIVAGPKESVLYDQILQGVKTIAHHKMDQQFNVDKVLKLENALKDIDATLKKYDVNAANASESWFPKEPKKAAKYLEMLKSYKATAEAALEAKNSAEKPNAFSRFTYVPEPEDDDKVPTLKIPPNVTVELRDSQYAVSSLDKKTGKLTDSKEIGSGHYHLQFGQEYVVKFQDGVEISYRPWSSNYSNSKSQQGQLRFRIPENHGSKEAALEQVLTQLRHMGLAMDDSSDEDLELLYWRHLYGIMNGRADRNTGKQKSVQDEVKKLKLLEPGMDPETETQLWRKAWGAYKGQALVDKWISEKGYLPKFTKANIHDHENDHGRPHWMRFDVDYDALKKKAKLSVANISGGLGISGYSDEKATQVAQSGGLLPTEERTRVLGKAMGGASSHADSSYGSANFVFLRQNIDHQATVNVYIDPMVHARTSTYAFDSDHYGNIEHRAGSAHFDFDTMTGHTYTGNEILVKYGISILDDVQVLVFSTPEARAAAIKFYADLGITTIRGVPIGDIFVTKAQQKTAVAQAKERVKNG